MLPIYLIFLFISLIQASAVKKETTLFKYEKSDLTENFKNTSQPLFRMEYNTLSPFECMASVLEHTGSQTILQYKLSEDRIICEGYKNKASYPIDLMTASYSSSRVYIGKSIFF